MALLGQLDEFQLHHIIGLLQAERQTGELDLDCDGRRARLYFLNGAIVHAEAAGRSGLEAALVPFEWQHGKFHFEAFEPQIDPTITMSNANIVSAGQRRAADAVEMRTNVPSMHLIVRLVHQVPGSNGSINLSFDDWRFLTLVDGKHDLTTLAAGLNKDDLDVRLMANRLIKAGLIDLVDPRQQMIRMVAMPTSLVLRPPADPAVALMDDLTLDMLLSNGRSRRAPVRAEVLTPGDRLAVVRIEGRPDLADRLLLSPVVLAHLEVERNSLVHLRLLDE